MTAIRTSLHRHQPITPWNDDEIRQKARKLWQETGTVMVKPEWITNDIDRQMVINVGEKQFGKRQA